MVKHPILDLSSGLYLKVVSLGPALGSMLGVETTLKKRATMVEFIFISEIKRLVIRFSKADSVVSTGRVAIMQI